MNFISPRTLAIFVTTLIFLLPAGVTSDEPTWSCYKETESCYYFRDFLGHQLEASCLCRSLGGYLIKLDSATEVTLVRQLMQNENRFEGFWLGATNQKNESRYMWEDGTTADDMIPWYDNEPNVPDTEFCITFANKKWYEEPYETLGDFYAYDVKCDGWNMYTLCEKGGNSVRVWTAKSRDEIYPSARMEFYWGVSSLECADICSRNCRCFSIAHRQDGGHCILYREHFRFLTSPQHAPGYVNFD